MSARLRTSERTVVLSFGSNLGSREEHLLAGVSMVERTAGLKLVAMSSLYETSPVDIAAKSTFINAVVVARTARAAADILAACAAVERAAGRADSGSKRDRTLDIDIIFYGDEVISEPGLAIPHPRFRERLFVLVPLAEIRPSFRIPPAGTAVTDVISRCGGNAWVRKVSGRSFIR